mmetsp:Transcript_21013/g.42902  ORF Transcript_21013/g.42902 Transcript_21013/m.42902 type:complete len:692 (-) Transcript_21013:160-2235(-)
MIRSLLSLSLAASLLLLLIAPPAPLAVAGATASPEKEQEVKIILERMEADVLAFRSAMESAYADRCSTETLTQCAYSNYNDCTSSLPNQICMEPEELIMSACGSGQECNALWSKTVSTVTFPSALAQGYNANPTDPELIETACYTRRTEEYMVDKYKDDQAFWSQYGVSPSWTYFGAHNGMFRQIPATHAQTCGLYDPRRRPWFVAASSGPKDVVLVIDTSGSMDDYGRMALAREAAITIVETLTVADRVAIVPFSTSAYMLGGETKLIRATKDNKDRLIRAIKGLSANGATNFGAAFSTAFNAIDTTIRQESTSGCNIAVLFMTDGQITEGIGANSVISLVNEQIRDLSTRYGRKAVVLTFSLGVNADHDVTKTIACQTNGIWTPVDDLAFGGDLVSAMSSYYKLFALGLGEGDNGDFTAWVEPYMFFTEGKMGTTVSAPVYDRSVDPPLFLGVVAVDSLMDALEQVLGEDATSSAMLERFVLLSTARCPRLNLTECELDALRYLGGGEDATCGKCTSGRSGIVPEQCRAVSDLPRDLWANTEYDGKEYHERACCELGESSPSDQCTGPRGFGAAASSLSTGAIVGIAVAAIGVALLICCYCYRKKAKTSRNEFAASNGKASGGSNTSNQQRQQRQTNGASTTNGSKKRAPRPDKDIPVVQASVVSGSGTGYDGVNVAMPPSANPGYVQN